jgi:sugar lactone lactonase YvrE
MKWRLRYLVVFGSAAVLMAAIVLGASSCSGQNEATESSVEGLIPGQSDDGEPRPVTDLVWPATLVLQVALDPVEQANQPADLALIDGTMFVVDTVNSRLLEVSADGNTFHVLDSQIDPKLALAVPLAIASNQGQLYVADSDAGRVVVVQPSGTVSRVIALAKGDPADAQPPRPIGIAVWNDGSFAVSDANNNRLLKYSPDGTLLWTVGTGVAATGENGFNGPCGLALDKDGNVYVVDILNSQVKKYSSDGKFLSSFGQSGETAGSFSRAKAVALDDAGNIYVSDGLGVAIQVFDQTGTFLGFIGRKDPEDPNSVSLFQAPHGLKIVADKLYVIDRFAGLFVFDLPASQ